ncbi:hypothetical protein SBA4_1860008 [Candidatus Sulfopaludibacter sp. SbA4]|nr:hypothetical protein SBA4_1860008 [Candidatus Sulfopaludibacter sp. SbA4]
MDALTDMTSRFRSFAADETGQDLAEYSLLIAFVLTAIIGLASGLHGSIAEVAGVSNSQLNAAQAAIR